MAPEPRAAAPEIGTAYDRGVFINCPFDAGYRAMFDAIAFAVLVCDLSPRSALEIDDASLTRLDKVGTLIGECRWGIHDISRVELNEHALPRFNMPFELGLFFGAKRFGDTDQRRKSCLVLDAEEFRFQKFISDISGQDVTPHGGDIGRAIRAVRGWLSTSLPPNDRFIPGGAEIARLFAEFQRELPGLCRRYRIEADELTFLDRVRIATGWLRAAGHIP